MPICNSLRHTTTSLLIANGTDVATVASLLGHAQVSTTLDICTHAFDKNRKKAAEELQKGLGV
ncbi:MAG: tyrosine-type recombinase/integrase [Oscillospiraceae bacterium]